MQSQKLKSVNWNVKETFFLLISNKNVNWNVKETFFILAAFDWIKLLHSEAGTSRGVLQLY